MTYPNDPNFRREFEAEADREGMTTATWASIAFVLLLFGGIAVWAYYGSDESSTTAAVKRPAVEQTMPPATTGQGGAASKMPAAKEMPPKE
jgi:hypothetical protein